MGASKENKNAGFKHQSKSADKVWGAYIYTRIFAATRAHALWPIFTRDWELPDASVPRTTKKNLPRRVSATEKSCEIFS